VPRSELVVLPDAGELIELEKPAQFSGLDTDFEGAGFRPFEDDLRAWLTAGKY
jgi:hypothetical protein